MKIYRNMFLIDGDIEQVGLDHTSKRLAADDLGFQNDVLFKLYKFTMVYEDDVYKHNINLKKMADEYREKRSDDKPKAWRMM